MPNLTSASFTGEPVTESYTREPIEAPDDPTNLIAECSSAWPGDYAQLFNEQTRKLRLTPEHNSRIPGSLRPARKPERETTG